LKKLLAFLLAVAAAAAIAWWWNDGSVAQPFRAANMAPGVLRGDNVLLITIDTLRADRVGAYGSTRGVTPTLDWLASEGIRFDRAHAHVPLTLPSHASLMTARIPPVNGVRDNGTFRLDPAHRTWATEMKTAGYQTAAFVGAFVLDARFGLGNGFDVYDDHYGERSAIGASDVIERPAAKVMTPAAAWIQSAKSPWFAWVHVYDPHEPYAPPEPFRSRYAAAPYDGEVAYVDSVLGEMLATLQRSGRLDRTLVIVTSDHGEGLGDHGERTHGLFAYESTLHVPLILWRPGRVAPGVDADLIGLRDVAPLIGRLTGVSIEPEAPAGATTVYFEAMNANLTRNWAPLTGMILGNLKLIDLPEPELYDLSSDPAETKNIYVGRQTEARRLEQTLDGVTSRSIAPSASPVDAETAARLRSLGYVVGQAAGSKRKFTAADDPKRLIALDVKMDDAMAMAQRGDVSGAVATLDDVIKQRPDLTVAYDRLAFVYRASGQIERAVAVLEDAASKGLADGPLLVSLGTALQEANKLDRSATVLEGAVKMNPTDLEALNRLGTTYARMGREADAEQAFRKALAIDAKSAETLTNLGVLFLTSGKRDEAIATLRQAITADPASLGARNTLAVVEAKSGHLEAAVDEWRRILELQPENPDVLYNAGTALLQLGRPQEAAPLLERFIASAPPRYADDVARVKQILASISAPRSSP
jgi:arylsulfatase A-like enzyme/Tfp pilus assembly protein PilF